jgi:hypothetical protein
MMANDAHVAAVVDAPPVTRILADFVATHPSRGWEDSVEREAHRSFLNWVGCAIGASRHPAVEAALAAVTELEPAAQAMILGRSERVDVASAALLNGISSHTFDFDDISRRSYIRRGLWLPPHWRWPSTGGRPAASWSMPLCSASMSSAASAMLSTRTTTIAAGISPDRPACWARPQPALACSSSTPRRRRWR